jgi:hypothetical protein
MKRTGEIIITAEGKPSDESLMKTLRVLLSTNLINLKITVDSVQIRPNLEDWIATLPNEDIPDFNSECQDWIRHWGNGGGGCYSTEQQITEKLDESATNNPREAAQIIYDAVANWSDSAFGALGLAVELITAVLADLTDSDPLADIKTSQPKWAEIRNEHYDDIEKCTTVDGWLTGNDNEEGEVIAKVFDCGRVEYIDPDAETDTEAQVAIQEVLDRLDPEPIAVATVFADGTIEYLIDKDSPELNIIRGILDYIKPTLNA